MKSEPESYMTVSGKNETRYPFGKCRFIIAVAPVVTEKEARSFIFAVKARYPDATHHVYAYRIGFGVNMIERNSDDREPSGTGGPPVLGAIRKKKLMQTIVVVVRYFGGVKLGVGGLIRAYRGAAEAGLDEAKIVNRVKTEFMELNIPYNHIGNTLKLISSLKGEVSKIEYGDIAKVYCSISADNKETFLNGFCDATQGEGNIVGGS